MKLQYATPQYVNVYITHDEVITLIKALGRVVDTKPFDEVGKPTLSLLAQFQGLSQLEEVGLLEDNVLKNIKS